jgi:hypothetical protein
MIKTLEEARRDIKQGWETPKGAPCPCCGQLVKLYPRQIYWGMAKGLIELYHLNCSAPGWHHIRELKSASKRSVYDLSDFSKLKYWGLIIPCPVNDNPKTKSAGLWLITEKGILFAENRLRVEKYAHVYNDNVEYFAGPMVGIEEALGSDFDYRDLMGYLL